MGIFTRLRGVARRIGELPGVRHARVAAYERRFTREKPRGNLYRGVYSTFAAAQATAPSSRPLGYDNEAAASMYRERTRQLFVSDYPVMLWMERLFRSGAKSVFDLGGHIGLAYYAFQKQLEYPAGLTWRVFDVPAVARAGEEWAATHDAGKCLSFAAKPEEVDGADILLAAGALQYLDYTLAELLAPLARRPRHLIVTLLPVHPGESYFTVQNIGTAYCPYRISAEPAFVESLKALGYSQRDRWEDANRTCRIPFHPGYSLDHYVGYCFSRD